MAITVDPTFPTDGQSPRLGAADIRGLTAETLELFGEPGNVAVTYALPPIVAVDHTTGLAQVQGNPTVALGIVPKQYADNLSSSTWSGTSVTAPNAYAVTLVGANGIAPANQATLTNDLILVKFTNGNTGPATLNANTFGAQAILNAGNPLITGQIPSGAVILMTWDGANYQILGSIPIVPTPTALPGARNLIGSSAGGTTNFAVTANSLLMVNPTTGSTISASTFAATENISVAGPILNGRDQAGAFTVSTFVHIYAISGVSQTTGLIASATAPPTGPTLPTNYTNWAYLTTVLLDGAGNILAMTLRGSRMYYPATGSQQILNGGVATVETSVSTASFVPAIALRWFGGATLVIQSGTNESALLLRYLTGSTYLSFRMTFQPGNVGANQNDMLFQFEVPQVAQNVFYLITATGGAPQASIFVQGYDVPNSF